MSRPLLLSTLTVVAIGSTWTLRAQAVSPGAGATITFDESYSDPDDLMTESLAQAENISFVEARRRLVLQHEAGILSHKLRAAYGDQFAGLMIDPATRSHINFYFVGIDLAEVREALPALGASATLMPSISLKDAVQSEAEMQDTATRMTQQLHAQSIDGSVAYSVPMGGYKILTTEPEKAAEAVRLGHVQGGEIIEIERSTGIILD